MTNTSATGGYLQPATEPAPLESTGLLGFIQAWLVGLSGLTGDMVRVALGSEPPNIPAAGTCWLAFRILTRPSDTFPYFGHNPAANEGLGADELQRHEVLNILCSVYDSGSTGIADQVASLIRDNAVVPQNMEPLTLAGMGLVSTGDLTPVPSLLKQTWLYRVDLPLSVRRQIVRSYPVQNILTVQATLLTDQGAKPVPINATP